MIVARFRSICEGNFDIVFGTFITADVQILNEIQMLINICEGGGGLKESVRGKSRLRDSITQT